MASSNEKPPRKSWESGSAHSSQFLAPTDSAPPYTAQDSRSSSMQSLLSDTSQRDGQRKLLVIYLHGFMGDESSFQKFPAHVHNVLSAALKETHKVHTKIYPKYRSKREITVARDNFSSWLTPHEAEDTDIVLVGHSMGGILGAEIVLLPPMTQEGAKEHKFRHRIIGTINIDVPFLGLHPGIIVSGISSLFRPADPTPVRQYASDDPASISDFSAEPLDPDDPNYNPAFDNDVQIARRTGWQNTLHFVLKHANSLPRATFNVFQTHFEFGSCLADFSGLKVRYQRLRELEDIDEVKVIARLGPGLHTPRVRFVNYFTASTGRKPKPEAPPEPETPSEPRLSEDVPEIEVSEVDSPIVGSPLETEDSMNLEKLESNLPPLPPTPTEPPPFVPDLYPSKDARKIALKDHERAVKAYRRALKDQRSALKDRHKLLARQAKQQVKKDARERLKTKRSNSSQQSVADSASLAPRESNASEKTESGKPRKAKKFCLTPDTVFGVKDDKWVRILMEDMDEVGAHCGMFFPSDTYEILLGGVVENIQEWLEDDASLREVLQNEKRSG